MSEVSLAQNSGFCFGVKRAVDQALKIQKQYDKKIYTLGPLIHNSDVVSYLEDHNIFSINLEDIDNLKSNDVIVIRSNGVSEDVLSLLEKKELTVINAKDISEFFDYIPGNPHFLYSALYTFTNEDTMNFFENHGIKLKVERGDRVFPK